jgi:hypothetical protein
LGSYIYIRRPEIDLPGLEIYLPPSEIDLEQPEMNLQRLQKRGRSA